MTRGVIMTLVIICAFQLVSQILSHADHLVGWLNPAPAAGRAWWQSGGAESFSGRVEHMVLSGLYDDQQLTALRITEQKALWSHSGH